eukprot:Amastigsp_a677350_26.p1 type:complete len:255 gc:universal Amastigsp_a677350_26:32-796(+)
MADHSDRHHPGSFTVQRNEFKTYAFMVKCYELRVWVETILEKSLPEGDVLHQLRDGVALCEVVNKIAPGTVAKIAKSKAAFSMMENVGAFITFAKTALHMTEPQLFMPVDLVEHRNLIPLVNALHGVAKAAAAAGLCVGIVAAGATHEFSELEIKLAHITLAAEDAPPPEEGQPEAPLALSDERHVADTLASVLRAVEGGSCTISQLGHHFLERTGVSWKGNMKRKGFGSFPEFLAKHPDLFTIEGETVRLTHP